MALPSELMAAWQPRAARCRVRPAGIPLPKVARFIPLTKLCRDVCHYCTFAERPRADWPAYLSPEDELAIARAGAAAGCTEALFTLGDKPEPSATAPRARHWPNAATPRRSAIPCALAMCALVAEGNVSPPARQSGRDDAGRNRRVARGFRQSGHHAGIRASARLCEPGQVHYGSPDKHPAARLETIALAGELNVPFTTGILIGIGETRAERLESLIAIRDMHASPRAISGEVIVQNFRAKLYHQARRRPRSRPRRPGYGASPRRVSFSSTTSDVQAPPNLSPGVYEKLIDAGIDDWGGVSPVTPDHVNPGGAVAAA